MCPFLLYRKLLSIKQKYLCPAEREMGFPSVMDESKTVAVGIRRSRFLVRKKQE